jgi:hypothetical protein
VKIEWFGAGSENGYVAIEVLAGDPDHVPHLIKRTVSDDGKRVGVVFGHYERKRVNAPPSSVQQLHSLLRSGMRTEELSRQYRLIHDTLQQLVDAQNGKAEVESVRVTAAEKRAEFERDKKQALAAGGFQSIPNLLLCAYPNEPVQMRGLLDPAASDLIRVLQSPPTLNGHGWDLTTNEQMLNIHGRMRRSVKEGWKLLQLTREGSLMFLARGDDAFLSVSTNQKTDGPLFVVPYVLAHTIYVFSLLAQEVFAFATPRPRAMTYELQLRNMENEKQAAMLHPLHMEINRYPSLSSYRPMPCESKDFTLTEPFEVSPGEITYELVAGVFEWFGFERDAVPRARFENKKGVIDDRSLFNQ